MQLLLFAQDCNTVFLKVAIQYCIADAGLLYQLAGLGVHLAVSSMLWASSKMSTDLSRVMSIAPLMTGSRR